MGDDPHDPFSGYRPDMDQYSSHKDVHEEVDQAFKMLGWIIITFMAVICLSLGYFFSRIVL